MRPKSSSKSGSSMSTPSVEEGAVRCSVGISWNKALLKPSAKLPLLEEAAIVNIAEKASLEIMIAVVDLQEEVPRKHSKESRECVPRCKLKMWAHNFTIGYLAFLFNVAMIISCRYRKGRLWVPDKRKESISLAEDATRVTGLTHR